MLRSVSANDPLLLRLARALKRAVSPIVVFDVQVLCRKGLQPALIPWQSRVPVEISIASEEDIEEAARLREREQQEVLYELYRSRHRRGQLCFVAKAGSAVVGFNWLAFRAEIEALSESGREGCRLIALREDEVWCLDAYTAFAWRGNAIHTALLHRMLEWAREAGYRTAYTGVAAANFRSWKTHRRLGWDIAHIYVLVQIPRLGRRWGWPVIGSRHPIKRYTGAQLTELDEENDRQCARD